MWARNVPVLLRVLGSLDKGSLLCSGARKSTGGERESEGDKVRMVWGPHRNLGGRNKEYCRHCQLKSRMLTFILEADKTQSTLQVDILPAEQGLQQKLFEGQRISHR